MHRKKLYFYCCANTGSRNTNKYPVSFCCCSGFVVVFNVWFLWYRSIHFFCCMLQLQGKLWETVENTHKHQKDENLIHSILFTYRITVSGCQHFEDFTVDRRWAKLLKYFPFFFFFKYMNTYTWDYFLPLTLVTKHMYWIMT